MSARKNISTEQRNELQGALFQYAHIWEHWYCIEEPDKDLIYEKGSAGQ